MADVTALGKGTIGRNLKWSMRFLVTAAALGQFLPVGMGMTAVAFGQDVCVVGLACNVGVDLQMTLSAFHMSMHGAFCTEKCCYGGVTLHALLRRHIFAYFGVVVFRWIQLGCQRVAGEEKGRIRHSKEKNKKLPENRRWAVLRNFFSGMYGGLGFHSAGIRKRFAPRLSDGVS